MKKILSLFLSLAVVLSISLSAACSSDTASSADSGDDTASSDTAAADTTVEINESAVNYSERFGLDPNDVVMRVNGDDVTAQEFLFLANYCYSYLNYYYGTYDDWDEEVYDGVTLKDYVLNDATTSVINYHIFDSKAPEYGLELDDSDYDAIEESKADYIAENFGDEATYLDTIENTYFVDDDTFTRLNITVPYIYNKLFTTIFGESDYLDYLGEDTVEEYAEENGKMKAAHILIKLIDDDNEPLDDETIAEKTELAYDLYDQIQNGADFWELMEEYNEDPGMENNPTGYEFDNSTSFVQEFKDGTAALDIGEVGIVQSSYGYHILMRLDYDHEAYAEDICWDQYADMIDSWCSEAEVEYTDNYYKIDITRMYE